ncbi:MAG: HD-GYP domain-containing protein [Clostridiales bacterium]|nr:HD-GYP domain-containing protein [Clostridiales bacterium]
MCDSKNDPLSPFSLFALDEEVSGRLELEEILASQDAVLPHIAFLRSMIQMKNGEESRAYPGVKQNYMDLIEALRVVVDEKDAYTLGHSKRVSAYAVWIGKKLGLGEDEVDSLRVGGLFHDIGKISVSEKILLKSGALDSAEYEEIKKHSLWGSHILSAISLFKEISPLIKSHHERIDGHGYPDGLAGEEIPFLARIITVADSFDAMMSDRTYRPKLTLQQTISQLDAGAGTQFDPVVTKAFLDVLASPLSSADGFWTGNS